MGEGALRMRADDGVTVEVLRAELTEILARAGNTAPEQEARDILAALHDAPRHWSAMHRESSLGAEVVRRVRSAAAKRATGAPFAYAVGRASFRHLTLAVDERALIPRQETELLVEQVLRLARPGCVVADIGTGSGAIALALASEGDFARVIATDVSRDALAVAKENVERLAPTLRAPVDLRHGSLLAPIGERLGALVSNPPYISLVEARTLPTSVRDWEPSIALFGGDDGMCAIAGLLRDAPRVLEPGGLLALEIDSRRAREAVRMAESRGAYDAVHILPDMTGRDRFLVAYAATTGGVRRRPPQRSDG